MVFFWWNLWINKKTSTLKTVMYLLPLCYFEMANHNFKVSGHIRVSRCKHERFYQVAQASLSLRYRMHVCHVIHVLFGVVCFILDKRCQMCAICCVIYS